MKENLDSRDKIFKKSAFTLVEFMISIGIIALIVSLTMPGFSQFTKRKNFERVVNNFASDIANVRSKAIAGAIPNRDQTVVPENDDLWGFYFRCHPSATYSGHSYYAPGTYYVIYDSKNRDTWIWDNYYSLNSEESVSGNTYKYYITCPGGGGPADRMIFFDKFTGLGSKDAGEFTNSDSVTVTIAMPSMGWTRDVVIYKTGAINVL